MFPVPKMARLFFVSTTGDSHSAPPPYEDPEPRNCVQVLAPGWPGAGMTVHCQMRRPVAASRACMLLLGLPKSPPLSPDSTIPLTYTGASEILPPFCHARSSVFHTSPPVIWSSATRVPSSRAA